MKAKVCRLYKNGREDRSNRECLAGDLSLGRFHHPVLGREVAQLTLLSDTGLHLLDPLMDAMVIQIGADGMRFRGIEFSDKGRQQAQEWWVRVVE